MKRKTQRVKDIKAQRALRARRAVDTFVTEADLLREYNAVAADLRPGGYVWRRCGRNAKRRLRSAIHTADLLVQKGELRAALKELVGA